MNTCGFGLVAGLVVAVPAMGQDFEFRRELATGSRFALRNIIGDVRIEGTSGRTLDVTAVKKAGRRGDPEDVEIKAVETNGGVAICVYYPGRRRDDGDEDDRESSRRSRKGRDYDDPCHRGNSWSQNDRNDTSVDFVVRVPAGLALDLKTVSGDVIGQKLRGEAVDVGSVSGDVSLTDVNATSLDANSVSGSIDLDRLDAKEVSAETVSGDVRFSGPIEDQGAYDFKTLSGDLILTVPGEPNADVTAVTFSGDLHSDFPVTRGSAKSRRHRFNATWGKGGAQVDLESFSGDIEIRSGK